MDWWAEISFFIRSSSDTKRILRWFSSDTEHQTIVDVEVIVLTPVVYSVFYTRNKYTYGKTQETSTSESNPNSVKQNGFVSFWFSLTMQTENYEVIFTTTESTSLNVRVLWTFLLSVQVRFCGPEMKRFETMNLIQIYYLYLILYCNHQ